MYISLFPTPHYRDGPGDVWFEAAVDGETVICIVPGDELNRLNGGVALRGEQQCLAVFEAQRDTIDQFARTILTRDGMPRMGPNGRQVIVSGEGAKQG